MKSKFGALFALLGSGFAAAAPYVDFSGAVHAVTTAHPALAPIVSIVLAVIAQHQDAILKPTPATPAA